jgi:hypothetical protein
MCIHYHPRGTIKNYFAIANYLTGRVPTLEMSFGPSLLQELAPMINQISEILETEVGWPIIQARVPVGTIGSIYVKIYRGPTGINVRLSQELGTPFVVEGLRGTARGVIAVCPRFPRELESMLKLISTLSALLFFLRNSST